MERPNPEGESLCPGGNARQKAPFEPRLGLNGRIKRHAMAAGMLCYPGGGTADGINGDHVLLAPPFIAGASEIEDIVERLGAAVDAALA